MISRERERERESNNSSRRLVVWALYDDAESSYKKAIKQYYPNKFEIHSIGINKKRFPEKYFYKYHQIDLSLSNPNLIEQLKNLPHPDIILASPPCESWSGADCGGRMFRSIDKNGNWIIKNAKYYDKYNENCHPVKHRNFIQKEKGRIIGESTIGGCILIIKEFKPKIWIIENPQTSKSWDFQEYHWNFKGNKNLAYYSAYDKNFSPKPTIFKSNIKINLNSKRVPGNNDHMARGSYKKRSSIPFNLIKEIIDKCLLSGKL